MPSGSTSLLPNPLNDRFMRLKTIAMMLTLGIAAGGEAPAQQAAPLNPTNFGLVSPQPQSELPHSATPPQQAVRKPKRPAQARLVPSGADSWVLSDGWELAQTDRLVGSDGSLFDSAYDTSAWYNAVAPGTVLTSLVEAGVYPDPYYGLNNLSIPDSLCRTEWWYRIRFPQPRDVAGHRVWLRFDGINYRADVWLNGRKAGTVDGAFTRGVFDATGFFSAENVPAVKIRPPPNPGIPPDQPKAPGRGPPGLRRLGAAGPAGHPGLSPLPRHGPGPGGRPPGPAGDGGGEIKNTRRNPLRLRRVCVRVSTDLRGRGGRVITCTDSAGGLSPACFVASNFQPQTAAGRPAVHILIRHPL